MNPLVLLHAFPFSQAMWYPQVAAFAAAGATLHALDQRGCANGAGDPGGYTLDDAASDVRRFLDERKIERAVLGGLSMGGYVALRFVERFPERLAGLVLSDTKATPDTEEGKRNRAALAAKVRQEGSRVAVESALPKLLARRTLDERPEIVGFVRALGETRSREGVARALEAMAARPDSTAVLARTSVPVLVLVGSEDAITPPSDAQALAAAAKGSRLLEISGAGHLANLEAPVEWNRAVLSFLMDRAR